LVKCVKSNKNKYSNNSASDYGSEGYRFESCRGHLRINKKRVPKGTRFFMLNSDASGLASARKRKKRMGCDSSCIL